MKNNTELLPRHKRQVAHFGERLKLARLRRKLRAQLVADRAGISRATLTRVEGGEANVSFASYFRVMRVLGLEHDIDLLAKDDHMGRKLQDLGLTTPKRSPTRPKEPS